MLLILKLKQLLWNLIFIMHLSYNTTPSENYRTIAEKSKKFRDTMVITFEIVLL